MKPITIFTTYKASPRRVQKNAFAFAFILFSTLLVGSCGPARLNGRVGEVGFISGKVDSASLGSNNLVYINKMSQKSFSVQCTQPVARLYALDSNGQKLTTEISSASVNKDGTYKLKFPNQKLQESDAYVVEIHGCSEPLARVVTSTVNQDISVGTSLISLWVPNGSTASRLATADKNSLNKIFASLKSFDSYTLAYSTILANSELSSEFQKAFGASPLTLLSVAPELDQFTVPKTLTEGSTSQLTMTLKHWSADYQYAYRWMIDDVVIGTTGNLAFTPSANMQGTHVIKVFYGAKDSSNELDTSKPYKQLSETVVISDAIPAVVPNVSLITSALTADRNVSVALDTGSQKLNCATFSRIAILEDIPTSPVLESEFDYTCDTAGTQALNFALTGADGPHTLYVWTRDAAGNVSQSYRALSLTLDTTAPALTIAMPNNLALVKGSFSLSGTCEAGSNVTFGGTDGLSQSTTCAMGVFSLTGQLSAGEGLKSISVSQTDVAGNSSSVNLQVTRDDTAPTPAIVSPASNSRFQSNFTLTGTCSQNAGDLNTVSITSAALVVSPVTATCTAGSFSAALSLVGADGLKSIAIAQNDDAGNSGIVVHSVYKDTTAPSISISSPNANFTTQSSLVLNGVCEDGPIAVSGDTSTTSITCSSSVFSQSIVLSGADGSKTINLSQTDSAGNTANYSRIFIKDTSAPDLNITSPLATDRIKSSVVASGTCEPGGQLDFTGADINPVTNVTCPGSGNFSQTLSVLGTDGAKSFNVDHRDSLSNVTSASVNFTKDNVAPTLSLTLPAALTATQSALTLTGSCGTAAGDSANVILESPSVDGAPITIPCSSGNFTQLIQLIGTDGTKTITLKQADSASNESQTSRSYEKDTTGPTLSISSPNSLSSFQSTLTLTGACETGLPVDISGNTSPVTATCSGSSFSQVITLSSGDGSKLITVAQTDASGNNTSVSRTFYKDTMAPVLTFNSPAAGSSIQSMVTITGTCEAGITIVFSGDISSPSNTSCASGSFSSSVIVTSGEGAKTLTLAQTDSAGNTGTAQLALVRDNTAPLLAYVSPLASSSFQNWVTVTGTCGTATGDSAAMTLSGPFSTSPLALNCVSGSFSTPVSLTGADGLKTLSIVQYDNASNSSTVLLSIYKDNVAPSLTISSPAASFATQSTITLTGACETGLDVQITGSIAAPVTATCSGGAYSQLLTLSGADGAKSIQVAQTDAATNSTSLSRSFIKDNTAPVVQTLSLNGGSTTTSNNFTTVTFTAQDASSNIQQFCLKYNDSSTPATNASCWLNLSNPSPNVTPSQNVSVSGFQFQVGISAGTYVVYLWTKDSAGNLSALSSSGAGTEGTDKATINFTPQPPPVVVNVMAVSSNSPSDPVSAANKTASSGSTMIVKWKATSANFGAAPITLSYTTDDTSFTNINSGNSIPNASNSGCTADDAGSTSDDGSTGCFVFASPSSGYFRVRVRAVDSNGFASIAMSNPVNVASTIDFIAGNTESGLNGSAISAVLFSDLGNSALADIQSFAIKNDGTVFFKDLNRGLLYVSPSDGVLKTYIPVTGSSTGDGGAPASATLTSVNRINLDFEGNLLIWDSSRIRKVDFAANRINTIIGGGASTADNVDALSFSVNATAKIYHTIQPAPNGDINFIGVVLGNTTENGSRIVRFDKATNTIKQLAISGLGVSSQASQDSAKCTLMGFSFEYDLNSKLPTELITALTNDGNASQCSVIGHGHHNPDTGATWNSRITAVPYTFPRVGLDGKIYGASRAVARVVKYNSATQSWDTLAGTGFSGSCDDGTIATSCAIDPQDVFVTAQSRVYFLDRGRIRVIGDDGKVSTVVGQSMFFGDSGKATSARFNKLSNIAYWTNGTTHNVIALDYQENRFREFQLSGNISTIAGNGGNNGASLGTDATAQPLNIRSSGVYFDDFDADPSNGNVYFQNGYTIIRLNRSTGFWENIAGGGATLYPSADGLAGSSVLVNSYFPHILGFANNKVLAMIGRWTGTAHNDSFIKSYDLTDSNRQSSLIGQAGAVASDSTNWCANGTSTSACAIPRSNWNTHFNRLFYDSYEPGGRWVVAPRGHRYFRSIAGGVINDLNTTMTAGGIGAWTYVHNASNDNFFYCNTSDNKLHKFNLTTNTDSTLSWPIATLQCSAAVRSMAYVPARNSLIFVYTQNNLDGIAEYYLP